MLPFLSTVLNIIFFFFWLFCQIAKEKGFTIGTSFLFRDKSAENLFTTAFAVYHRM